MTNRPNNGPHNRLIGRQNRGTNRIGPPNLHRNIGRRAGESVRTFADAVPRNAADVPGEGVIKCPSCMQPSLLLP